MDDQRIAIEKCEIQLLVNRKGEDHRNRLFMDALPFAASIDALAFIVKQVRVAIGKPELDELVPALGYWHSSFAFDEKGKRLFENIPFGFYEVGWCQRQDVNEAEEVDVLGTKVFVNRQTLETLAGKRLVLRKTDSIKGRKELLVAENRV